MRKLKIQETFKWNIEKSHLARTLDSYYGQYDEEAVICTLKGDQASLEKSFKKPLGLRLYIRSWRPLVFGTKNFDTKVSSPLTANFGTTLKR